jgi:hypothetical protein
VSRCKILRIIKELNYFSIEKISGAPVSWPMDRLRGRSVVDQ